mmetsp:Transcript_27845/g.88503  ORF Transcript_27845/g.88503 Transcript_27845/m.88503 type:complete len:738 (-) Transcript_27845:714-2927(-)
MDYLRTSRPTAVNLFNAMDALGATVGAAAAAAGATASSVLEAYLTEAEKMPADDVAANRAMGRHGAEEILRRCGDKDKVTVLHICNTGTLATAGYGTALGIVRALKEMGRLETCYVMETRPYLQGARLTAYECVQDDLNGVLIPDSAAAFLMARKGVDACVCGADRVANNGDTANKIGTFQMAISAARFGIPLIVASPTTTFDLSIASGDLIPIEERKAHELRCIKRPPCVSEDAPAWIPIAPEEIGAWNPAFDVTPRDLIAGIATEKGVALPNANTGSFDLTSFVAAAGVAANGNGNSLGAGVLQQAKAEGYLHYRKLDEHTVGSYLVNLPKAAAMLGTTNAADLTCKEVGDGNLNLVFIVEGPQGAVVLKQALPYVRCVGEAWPLSLSRASFEAKALMKQAELCPEHVPEVYHFDEELAVIVMHFIAPPHLILRKNLIEGNLHTGVGQHLGIFLAKTLFGTSTIKLSAADVREQLQFWAKNNQMCELTEQVIFYEPYVVADNNRHTTPQLDDTVAALRRNTKVKLAIAALKHRFMHCNEALIHADLHTGSVMNAAGSTLIIDPEFAFYGPMGFDVGAIIGNFLLHFFSLGGRGTAPSGVGQEEREAYTLMNIVSIWDVFRNEFEALWDAEESDGDSYRRSQFGESEEEFGAAKDSFFRALLADSLGFAGAKMIRRVVGIAHVEDLDGIEDADARAECEKKAIAFGSKLVTEAAAFAAAADDLSMRGVIDAARAHK